VRACLDFAQKHNVWLVMRSGGHSTACYSMNSGMVVDLSKMCYANVDTRQKRVAVGAGTPFGFLNNVLHEYGLHVPTGACPDVCVAGYTQGGGYGFTSREFGMTCDNVVEVKVMLADQRIVTASATQNPDLFWAIRGGTGGNFGVLLELTYRLRDLGTLWGFWLRWPIEGAADILVKLQTNYTRTGTPKLGYQAQICYQSKGNAPENLQPQGYLLMRGIYNGSEAEGRDVLKSLLNSPRVEIQHAQSSSYFDLNNNLAEIPTSIPEVPDLAREEKHSVYIARRFSKQEWQIIDAFHKTPNQYSMINMEIYGGAINAVPPDECAFIHRDVEMDLFLDVFWMSDEERTKVVQYLDDFISIVHPMGNGHSYQNYPRRAMKDYRWEFFGTHFNTLLAIKKKYDPDNAFHFQQSIKEITAAERTELTADNSPILPQLEAWIQKPISYDDAAGIGVRAVGGSI
jgi:hypothetical protein